MENHNFYRILLPADFILFDIKNFKQVQYRSLTLLEKMILSIANYFSETNFSVYEVLFTTCLKISMKPFIQSIIDELYYNNYLELNTDFKIDILEKNLLSIQNELYGNKDLSDSGIRKPTLKHSKNCLEFSRETIQSEIQKILCQTRYLYQYMINKRGIKALEENRIKTYKDDGNSSLELISINCPNDKLSILNHLISSQNTSGFTRMKATERKMYFIISEILTEKDNLLKSKEIDFDFISFNNNTEIEETSTKNGAITFTYNLNSKLTAINIQKGLLNSALQEIINGNLGFFEKNKVLNCKPFDFLQEKILNLSSDYQYPKDKFRISNSKICLEVSSIEDLNYIKNYLPEPYKESIYNKFYRFEFNEPDYNLNITFPLIIYPDSSNYDVFSKFTKDFIYHNYIIEKKVISFKELDEIFTVVSQKYSEIDDKLGEAFELHYKKIQKDFIEIENPDYEIYFIDELLTFELKKNFPGLIDSRYKIFINTERSPIITILKQGINSIRSLYNNYPEQRRNFEIQFRNLDKKKIEYEVKTFPNTNKIAHIELIKVLLMKKFGINSLIILQEFIKYISEILEEWENNCRLYGEKFNNYLKNTINLIDSEEFLDLYNEFHKDKDLSISIFEIEANKIKSQLEEETNLDIGIPFEFNLEKKQFTLLYFLDPQELCDILNKEDDGVNFIKKSLIEHQEVSSKQINENLTLNYKLTRIIKLDNKLNQGSGKPLIKLFLLIFSKILQGQDNYSTINKLFKKFEIYINDYNNILNENKINDLISLKFYEEIYPTFIDELNKSGYLFFENLIINELNTQIRKNFEFEIYYLKISEVSNQDFCYEIDETNYKQIKKNFDLTKPLTIQVSRNNKPLDLNCYFLPRMNSQNIFQNQFFNDFITERFIDHIKNVKEKDYYLLEELREIFEGEFDELTKLYELVKQEHFLSKKRIRKYIKRRLDDDEFLKNFVIINPFINQKIQKDRVVSNYQLFNPNKIKILKKDNNIEVNLSKKEILSFNDINDFKHIATTHILNFKLKNTIIKYTYYFNALDQYGMGYIEIIKHYFKNNKDYSTENFLKINYEQFKTEIQQKYADSENLEEINKIFRNLNMFTSFLRELNEIFNNAIKIKK